MKFGAAYVLAKELEASDIIDPRSYAKGEIKKAFEEFTHIAHCLPALGYGKKEIKDLQETISGAEKDCDVVIVGTPINLKLILKIEKPTVVVQFALKPKNPDGLRQLIGNVQEEKDVKPILKKMKANEKKEQESGKVDLDEGEIGADKIQKAMKKGDDASKSKKSEEEEEEEEEEEGDTNKSKKTTKKKEKINE